MILPDTFVNTDLNPGIKSMSDSKSDKNAFQTAAEAREHGLIAEFIQFLRENKKWWLAPILLVLLMMGALILLSGSAAAPFIYTLF